MCAEDLSVFELMIYKGLQKI